jgi:hypothetical protein
VLSARTLVSQEAWSIYVDGRSASESPARLCVWSADLLAASGPLLLHCRKGGFEFLSAMDKYPIDRRPAGRTGKPDLFERNGFAIRFSKHSVVAPHILSARRPRDGQGLRSTAALLLPSM